MRSDAGRVAQLRLTHRAAYLEHGALEVSLGCGVRGSSGAEELVGGWVNGGEADGIGAVTLCHGADGDGAFVAVQLHEENAPGRLLLAVDSWDHYCIDVAVGMGNADLLTGSDALVQA